MARAAGRGSRGGGRGGESTRALCRCAYGGRFFPRGGDVGAAALWRSTDHWTWIFGRRTARTRAHDALPRGAGRRGDSGVARVARAPGETDLARGGWRRRADRPAAHSQRRGVRCILANRLRADPRANGIWLGLFFGARLAIFAGAAGDAGTRFLF